MDDRHGGIARHSQTASTTCSLCKIHVDFFQPFNGPKYLSSKQCHLAVSESFLWRSSFMQIDLHGYHPSEIVNSGVLDKIVQQAWEMGESNLIFIHGHGRNRGITPGFVNTNTGYFGLCIRRSLRHHDGALQQWIFSSSLDCKNRGSTSVRLKPNPAPNRKEIDCLPDRQPFAHHRETGLLRRKTHSW